MASKDAADTTWLSHSQTGSVSAVQSVRHGGPISEVRVRTDCPAKSLLAAVSRGFVEAAAAGRQLSGRGGDVADVCGTDPDSDWVPVLVGQLGDCRHQRSKAGLATLQLLSGRLFLRGETVLVSGGLPYFSENSQLAAGAAKDPVGKLPEPPALVGQPERDFLGCVTENLDGACLFYGPTGLQLSGRQTLLRQPQLVLSGRRHQLGEVSRVLATLRPVVDEELPTETAGGATATSVASAFVRNARASSIAAATATPATAAMTAPLPMSRILLLLGGRCLLRGDSLLVLSGLLHFAGDWQRVGEGAHPPVLLRGTSLLQRRAMESNESLDDEDDIETLKTDEQRKREERAVAASEQFPLLLSNAWLYAGGGTVFWGLRPLLTNATITMATELKPVPLAQQERLLGRLLPPKCLDVARLFLQNGRFHVSSGGLTATGGVAWLRAKKVQVGSGKSERLVLTGGLVFLNPTELQEGVSYECRDLLYKDGLLYLDDLTPLMKGGQVSYGHQDVPLAWLSGSTSATGSGLAPEQRASNISLTPVSGDLNDTDVNDSTFGQVASAEIDLLTEGICLFESGCIHVLRGRLKLPGETVIIDQGVAHFGPVSGVPSFVSAGFPPPRVVGLPQTRPSETRQWAQSVDQRSDTAIFVDAKLSVMRGSVWLNGQLPLIKGCRLVLNGRQFDGPQLLSEGKMQLMKTPGFTGTYSVIGNCKSEVLVFSLKARFAEGLHFLFGP